MRSLLLCSFLAISVPAIAQSNKAPISLSVTSNNDQVIERVVFEVKEGIRKSSSMTLVPAGRAALIDVVIVGLPPTPNSYSSYAITWTLRGPEKALSYYLTTSVATCGALRAKECAESIVAATDEEAEKWAWANAPLAK